MRKGISLVLTLALLLPLLSVMGMKAQAAEEDALRKLITEQYDAYAASIKQKDADEKAIRQLLNHSLEHPGQLLVMDERDPLTASMFQTNMFREYMIESLVVAMDTMQSINTKQILLGSMSTGWHDFYVGYNLRQYHYNETVDHEDDVLCGTLIEPTKYTGPINAHDKAMMLVVGGMYYTLRIQQMEINEESVRYRVDMRMYDEFQFDSDYNQSAAEGYDVSLSLLINMVGKLFLNTFTWYTTAGFEITVPNSCTHQSGIYRWEDNGTDLYSVNAEGLTGNTLTRTQTKKADGTLSGPYYETEKTIHLLSDRPWVVEFRIKGGGNFILSPNSSASSEYPSLFRTAKYMWGMTRFQYGSMDAETGEEVVRGGYRRYGLQFQQNYAREMHTYRVENRIVADGSNMAFLLIDGEDLGPLDHYWQYRMDDATGEMVYVDMETSEDWFNGLDFGLNYIFTSGSPYNGSVTVEYVQIWELGQDSQVTDYFETTTTAPTCTEPGKIVHTCALCGASYFEATSEPLAHTLEMLPGTAATCETEGLTEGAKCTTCGEIVTAQEVIPATGHSPVVDAAVGATCTTDGLTEGSHCETCGKVLTAQETITALGHNWDEGSEVTKPTVNVPGTILYTCTLCGELRGEEIPYESQVSRLAGEHRYETAFKAADQMKANLGIKKFDSVVVASGTNFADALSGSYLAAVKEAPILLACDVEWVNDLVKDYIYQNLNEDGTIYILGGEGAVPASFEEGLDDFEIERLAGGNRFETNLLVLEEAGVGDKPILVCTGLEFADSLSASATKLPILLVYGDKLLPDQAAFLKANQGRDLYIIGGEGAVSAKLESALTAYGDIERVAGGNRFETSTLIAETFFEAPTSVVLAYGWNFPDGLCGGGLAASMNAPMLLTMERYEAAATAYAQAKGIKNSMILGGDGLIPDASVRTIFALGEDAVITVK